MMSMDVYEYEEKKLQAVSSKSSYRSRERRRYHLLKKTLQLVFSVALLSYFLCHSTYYYSGFSLFPHSFSVYFSTFLFSFFAHTLERKYMFLICNGILAFLAKSSVMTSRRSEPEPEPEYFSGAQTSTSSINSNPMEDSVTHKGVVRLSDDGDAVLAEGEEQENDIVEHNLQHGDHQEDKYYESLLGRVEILDEEEEEKRESDEVDEIVEDDEEYEGESGCSVIQKEEGKGGAAASEDVVSTEELNRRFEEFIKKMKGKIRVEAQQQLIAV